jgi:hypothetical protein
MLHGNVLSECIDYGGCLRKCYMRTFWASVSIIVIVYVNVAWERVEGERGFV